MHLPPGYFLLHRISSLSLSDIERLSSACFKCKCVSFIRNALFSEKYRQQPRHAARPTSETHRSLVRKNDTPCLLTDGLSSNFQGVRKRITIASDYSSDDPRLKPNRTAPDHVRKATDEYEELDSMADQFESYVRPALSQSQWISQRSHERSEINRLGDLVDFYAHKPHLTELEQRVYKRLTRVNQAVQTDDDQSNVAKTKKARRPTATSRPLPQAMEHVEKFLADSHWRLVDLFRTLDRNKSWNVVKDDFMRVIERVTRMSPSSRLHPTR